MAKKIICDTDVMIDYLDCSNTRHSITKSIIEETIALDQVVLSAITKMELMVGATNKKDLIKISRLLHRFDILNINNEITIKALNLLEDHHLSHGLAIPDCLIAATAIISDLDLFTYNTKDFKFIKGLRLFQVKK
jgi:hypothetical protein